MSNQAREPRAQQQSTLTETDLLRIEALIREGIFWPENMKALLAEVRRLRAALEDRDRLRKAFTDALPYVMPASTRRKLQAALEASERVGS